MKTFLLSKTSLSENKINIVCESICQFQAKRNFELEVLANQVLFEIVRWNVFLKVLEKNLIEKTKNKNKV